MMQDYAMQGLDTILHMLECLQEDTLTASAQEGLADGLSAICEEAQSLCPRDTGKLQASIHVRRTASGGEVVAAVPYAALVELGTAYSPAQPFLFPAMRANQSVVTDGVQRAISRQLGRG